METDLQNSGRRSKPWADGPKEILEHAFSLLQNDNDRNRRLAFLSIDNAVELTVKTYLGLPKRLNGLEVGKKEFSDFSESFPQLLNALEKYAKSMLAGIDLGEIEWFHRLRNQLYHHGNGLTVDLQKVEVYSELAKLLFTRLFGQDISFSTKYDRELLGEFLESWASFEMVAAEFKHYIGAMLPGLKKTTLIEGLSAASSIEEDEITQIKLIQHVRNKVIHGDSKYQDEIKIEMLRLLDGVTKRLRYEIEKIPF